ncbi:hypothetical protein F5B20DRAFT_132900 [Whalleya microplaca]|nr:hypothetical protein F5B20DRAFT_132900 [Whalleya microplaca]
MGPTLRLLVGAMSLSLHCLPRYSMLRLRNSPHIVMLNQLMPNQLVACSKTICRLAIEDWRSCIQLTLVARITDYSARELAADPRSSKLTGHRLPILPFFRAILQLAGTPLFGNSFRPF